jgi:hypothetical protein
MSAYLEGSSHLNEVLVMMLAFKHTCLAAGVLVGAAAFGCGDDSDKREDGLSVAVGAAGSGASTKVDLATSQAALTALTSAVDTTVTDYKPPTGAAVAGGASGGMLAVKCGLGGNASVGGHVDVALQPVSVDVNVAIDYEGCMTPTGTSMTGNVDFTQSVVAGPATAIRVQTTYKGNVVFTGKVNARCPVDLNVLVDETGRAVQVMGTFCGNDASEMNVEIQPRWQG